MSIHKSIKSLKRDGILIMLFDLVVLLVSVERNRGFFFTASTLNSIFLNFIVYIIINAWWAIDSKKWITDRQHRKFIWLYILLETALLLIIGLLTMINQLIAASVLVIVLAFYSAFGIWLIIRYIKK